MYKNKDSFDKRNAKKKGKPLEEDSLLGGLGTSKNEALIVEVHRSATREKRGSGSSDQGIALNVFAVLTNRQP